MKTYLTLDKQLRSETDPAIIATLERKGWVPAPQPAYDPATQQCEWVDGEWVVTPIPPTLYTAEQWLTKEGVGSDRQPTLLYLKLQLDAAGKVSAKLDATQNFLNLILTEYAQNPSAQKSDWTPAPFTFEETIQEALTILNS